LNNQEYGKIINERHFQRLMKLMEGNKVLLGGKSSATQLKIEPTILEPENPASGVMNEEIFGPLLPLIEFEKKEEVVNYINSKPKPLALYVFSNNIGFQDFILENTSSGGVSINETIMHMTNPNMPFGGVGDSGIGGYHGKFSFDTFTHKKAVMKRSFLIDAPLRYPPFNKISISRLKFLVSKFL
jgi:aldehyde dehydrogenase (NAD+)